MPPQMAAAATRPGPSHRGSPPPPLQRSLGGGAGSCPMALTQVTFPNHHLVLKRLPVPYDMAILRLGFNPPLPQCAPPLL
jgi:hypothetical protein